MVIWCPFPKVLLFGTFIIYHIFGQKCWQFWIFFEIFCDIMLINSKINYKRWTYIGSKCHYFGNIYPLTHITGYCKKLHTYIFVSFFMLQICDAVLSMQFLITVFIFRFDLQILLFQFHFLPGTFPIFISCRKFQIWFFLGDFQLHFLFLTFIPGNIRNLITFLILPA